MSQELNNNTQVTGFAPTKTDKVFSKGDHFKVSDIELYFQRVTGIKQLQPNQTIRLTYDSYRWDTDINGYVMNGVLTYKRQIASTHDLLKFMDAHTDNQKIPRSARNDPLMRAADMIDKPITREFGDFLQRARFLEKMCRAWDDLEFHFTAHPIACLLV